MNKRDLDMADPDKDRIELVLVMVWSKDRAESPSWHRELVWPAPFFLWADAHKCGGRLLEENPSVVGFRLQRVQSTTWAGSEVERQGRRRKQEKEEARQRLRDERRLTRRLKEAAKKGGG